MGRILLIAATVLLGSLLVTSASGTGTLPATPEPIEHRVLLSEHGEEGDSLERPMECGGFAPWKSFCTTGPHVREGNSLGLSIEASNYEGTLEARLDWTGEPAVLRCDIQDGEATCSFTGAYIPEYAVVVHNCWSYDLGTSTPGGSGFWACGFVQ